MSFVVIALSFALQWFLRLSSAPYQKEWMLFYIEWMQKRFGSYMQPNTKTFVLVLYGPILIIMSLIFSLVYHLFGHFGYLIFSLLLFWYCIDLTAFKEDEKIINSAETFLLTAFEKIFTPLLWYFVVGPVGLTFAIIATQFRHRFGNEQYVVMIDEVVTWVPVRVLGFTFALAGNFTTVFKTWMKNLVRGLRDESLEVVNYAKQALGVETLQNASEVVALLQRTLLIWLVLIALLSVSGWIG